MKVPSKRKKVLFKETYYCGHYGNPRNQNKQSTTASRRGKSKASFKVGCKASMVVRILVDSPDVVRMAVHDVHTGHMPGTVSSLQESRASPVLRDAITALIRSEHSVVSIRRLLLPSGALQTGTFCEAFKASYGTVYRQAEKARTLQKRCLLSSSRQASSSKTVLV